MKVKFKKLNENAVLPTYATEGSAAMDLYVITDSAVEIKPGESKVFDTGLAVEIPEGYVGLIVGRSGLGFKNRISLANRVGVIDSDYRGEIKVKLSNENFARTSATNNSIVSELDKAFTVSNHDRVAQMLIMPVIQAEIELTDELSDTERGANGFGSTGVK